MKPKDLLEHLEKGDRTIEMLTRPAPSPEDFVRQYISEIANGSLSGLMGRQDSVAQLLAGSQLGLNNQMNQFANYQNQAMNQGMQNGNIFVESPQIVQRREGYTTDRTSNPFRRFWNR